MNKKKNKKKNKNHQNINTAKNHNAVTDKKVTLDSEAVGKEDINKEDINKAEKEAVYNEKAAVTEATAKEQISEAAEEKITETAKSNDEKKSENKTEILNAVLKGKEITSISSEQAKLIAISGFKVLLPVAACAIVIAFIISLVSPNGSDESGDAALNSEKSSNVSQLTEEPLKENAYDNVNELMHSFFKALADGDTDTIVSLMDYNDETSLITYEKRSEFIEDYTNITCYTKPGLDENSYCVYVTYDVKVKDIDTTAPGLNAFYVYTSDDGNLKIDGDMDEKVDAAFKLVTNQDDVVDLYNRIDVSYKEAVTSDETLNNFMAELPGKVKTSVGEALAQIEGQNDNADEEPETDAVEKETQEEPESEEQPQNQVVNQIVRATDTVNVRKSDSEEADRIGKVTEGTELTRIEDRINGWSKVIYDGNEAYIKSDYLEVVSTEAEGEVIGSIKAKTNVNVRSAASQESEKLGVAQADTSYELLENVGEWYRIKYNGMTGYVKAEFFEAE